MKTERIKTEVIPQLYVRTLCTMAFSGDISPPGSIVKLDEADAVELIGRSRAEVATPEQVAAAGDSIIIVD